MSMFSNMTEKEYTAAAAKLQLASPGSPPSFATYSELAKKFSSFALDDGTCCCCGKGLRGRCRSMDFVSDDLSEMKSRDDDDDEDPRLSTFSYEGRAYCCLDCFFSENKEKPMLCMYVDKLASILVELRRVKAGGGRK